MENPFTAKCKQLNRSKWTLRCVLALCFCFLLLLNCLTPYLVDDYTYMVSFATKDWISTIGDIFPSMYVHAFTMNGRLLAHGLEQLFMLMPKLVFNLCNAAVFTLLMYLSYRICSCGRERSVGRFLAVCIAFWVFLPAFGQVCLWQVGSLNYLWALLWGTLYLLPFIRLFLTGEDGFRHHWQRVVFAILALPVGAYTEITSFIVLLVGVGLLLLRCTEGGLKRLKSWLWFPELMGAVGYLLLMSIPAERQNKSGELVLEDLIDRFSTATEMLKTYLLPLCIAWACLWVLSLLGKGGQKKLRGQLLSLVLTLGALAGNYMTIAASYYPERCMCTTALLLILACDLVLPETTPAALKNVHGELAHSLTACAMGALTIVFCFNLVEGTIDIWDTHTSFTARETVIAEAVEAGETDLTLACIHPSTQYSAAWGLKDLDTEDSTSWPNNSMAAYYGVDSIIGY
ncbi:MAG: DUF6056 family protein [Oscillospiraceae bacterium]|nr:DUF6056 family protein [Oscillospiraceae bacterium]